ISSTCVGSLSHRQFANQGHSSVCGPSARSMAFSRCIVPLQPEVTHGFEGTIATSVFALECHMSSKQPSSQAWVRNPRSCHAEPLSFQLERTLLLGADPFDIPRAIDVRDPFVPFDTVLAGIGGHRIERSAALLVGRRYFAVLR